MPIWRHDVHVCLVSVQATPNFIPVLEFRTEAVKSIQVGELKWIRGSSARNPGLSWRIPAMFPAGQISVRKLMESRSVAIPNLFLVGLRDLCLGQSGEVGRASGPDGWFTRSSKARR